jgi:hypothetical protein
MLHLAVWGGVSRHLGCTAAALHVDNCHGADALPVQLCSVPKSGILQNHSEDGAEFFRRLLQFSEGSLAIRALYLDYLYVFWLCFGYLAYAQYIRYCISIFRSVYIL